MNILRKSGRASPSEALQPKNWSSLGCAGSLEARLAQVRVDSFPPRNIFVPELGPGQSKMRIQPNNFCCLGLGILVAAEFGLRDSEP
jgi:hypothetical protein